MTSIYDFEAQQITGQPVSLGTYRGQVLLIVLKRLYVLRNQLMHGGATWSGAVNRDQVRDCANLLGKLAPIVIEIRMDHPQHDWGAATYPVVNVTAESKRRA